METLIALLVGFALDLLLGDPQGFPHPVVWMGRGIAWGERQLRRCFPATPQGERLAGAALWVAMVTLSALLPALPGVVLFPLALLESLALCAAAFAPKPMTQLLKAAFCCFCLERRFPDF